MLPKGAILYGDYGVGKSALINVFANEFYGDLSDSDRVRMCKIVDASSDGRGVSLITDDFTNFAKSPTVCSRDGRLKLFVIEEADNLTKAAQSFLKSAMDLQKNRVRVFFLTNHIEKINEGIKERCVGAIFKFKPVPAVEIRDRLVYIIKEKKIDISDEDILKIIKISNGVPRRAIGLLDAYVISGNLEVAIDSLDVTNPDDWSKVVVLGLSGKVPEASRLIDELRFQKQDTTMFMSISRLIRKDKIDNVTPQTKGKLLKALSYWFGTHIIGQGTYESTTFGLLGDIIIIGKENYMERNKKD